MVPKGWKLSTFSKHVDCLTGFAFKSENYSANPEDIRLLRGDNIEPSRLRWRNAKYWPANEYESLEKFHLRKGDFVIAMDRTWVSSGLKVAEVLDSDIPCLLVQRVARIRALSTLDQELLGQFFSNNNFEQYVKSVQTATAVPHISPNHIKDFSFLLPPINEQRKIAKILSTWDKAISTTEHLLTNSQKQKKSLMQELLAGKRRFPGFSGEWKKVSLGEIFSRVMKKNSGCSTNVVTISGQQGLILQGEFFKKNIASEILDDYFLIKKGQFAYNKSYSIGYPMGAIKRLNRYECGVVTTLYICFELSDLDNADSDYFEHYFESGMLNRGLTKIAHEGGRAHGLLNVKPSDFFSLSVFLPPIDEQKKIAGALTIADCEITTLQQKLHYLKQEKKALMQQLLTGKRRVKVEAA